MAQIIKTASVRDDAALQSTTEIFTPDDMTEAIKRYWGSVAEERAFPIAFWKIKQLFSASSGEIALRVTNITDPLQVDARWIVFDEALEDAVQDPVQKDVYYFVFEESSFYGPIIVASNPPKIFQGMNTLINSKFPYKSIILGKIGKDTTNDYTVFFNAEQHEPIDTGGGNGGATGGAKVPPNR